MTIDRETWDRIVAIDALYDWARETLVTKIVTAVCLVADSRGAVLTGYLASARPNTQSTETVQRSPCNRSCEVGTHGGVT